MIAAMKAVISDTRTALWMAGFSRMVRNASMPKPSHATRRRPVLNE
jgi:hypothetical protein